MRPTGPALALVGVLALVGCGAHAQAVTNATAPTAGKAVPAGAPTTAATETLHLRLDDQVCLGADPSASIGAIGTGSQLVVKGATGTIVGVGTAGRQALADCTVPVAPITVAKSAFYSISTAGAPGPFVRSFAQCQAARWTFEIDYNDLSGS